jgi:hypothetical protein
MLFYTAEDLRGGTSAWANQLCDTIPALCRHPDWPAFAAAALISVVVVTKLASGR